MRPLGSLACGRSVLVFLDNSLLINVQWSVLVFLDNSLVITNQWLVLAFLDNSLLITNQWSVLVLLDNSLLITNPWSVLVFLDNRLLITDQWSVSSAGILRQQLADKWSVISAGILWQLLVGHLHNSCGMTFHFVSTLSATLSFGAYEYHQSKGLGGDTVTKYEVEHKLYRSKKTSKVHIVVCNILWRYLSRLKTY